MTKKILSAIVSFAMILCTLSAVVPALAEDAVSVWDGTYAGGDTTDWAGYSKMTDWFNAQKDNATIEITSAKQLAALAYLGGRASWTGWGGVATTYADKTIKLMTDIDLDGKQWVPICYDQATPFLGTFDGNGHKIKNIYGKNYENYTGVTVSRSSFGLFGTLGGTVKNLCVDGVVYDLDLSVVTKPIVGVICGNACYYTGASRNATAVIDNCAIKNVTFNVTKSASFSANNLYGVSTICGGGYNLDIKNTYVNGVAFNMESSVANFQYGGFANFNRHYESTSFANCYLANAKQSIGGVESDLKWGHVYAMTGVNVANCYSTSAISDALTGLATSQNAEQIATALKGSAVAYYFDDSKNANGGFPIHAYEVVNDEPQGGDDDPIPDDDETPMSTWDGSAFGGDETDWAGYTKATDWFDAQKDNEVIEITSAKQLAALAYFGSKTSYAGWGDVNITFEGKTIKLMTNIDLDNSQWSPICFDPNYPFLGTFDGNGYTIKNLYGKNLEKLHSGITYASFGLFGVMGGTVKNLKIINYTYDLDLSVVNKPIAGVICGNACYYSGSARNTTAVVENCAIKNVTFNVTKSATFSANNTYGVSTICGGGYNMAISNTYANGVTFNFENSVANFQYGGFANSTRYYNTATYTDCYLANAKQSIGGAEATDLKWGHFYDASKVGTNGCYTSSNTTEASGAINKNKKATEVTSILVEKDIGYFADTYKKNAGYPVLKIEAKKDAAVSNLAVTKNGDKFTASAVIKDVPETTKLVIAVYDKTTGKLVSADMVDSYITYTDLEGYASVLYDVKAFVWDMADNTPLADVAAYTE